MIERARIPYKPALRINRLVITYPFRKFIGTRHTCRTNLHDNNLYPLFAGSAFFIYIFRQDCARYTAVYNIL